MPYRNISLTTTRGFIHTRLLTCYMVGRWEVEGGGRGKVAETEKLLLKIGT